MAALRFALLGTHGIPANYGGFETFAEEVALRLVKRGVEVLVVGDKNLPYPHSEYKGVKIRKTKTSKPGNPLQFYKESLEFATEHNADFILVCGVGGTIFLPFYKNKKAVIAVNPDGLGFKRDKYRWWKKTLFYTQYYLSAKISEYLVCDSKGIETYYRNHFGRKKNMRVIEYGTYINPFLPTAVSKKDFIQHELPYVPFQYHLIVARLEPENNVKTILKGYSQTNRKFPLVVVGNTNTPHAQELLRHKTNKVHFIGGVYKKEKLQLLRAASLSYWHGHSVGGTNPSLLEAMGSSNLCVCHDNIFTREVIGENGLYFSNYKEVSSIFDEIEKGLSNRKKLTSEVLTKAKDYYNWELITEKYLNFARETTGNNK